MRKTLTLLGCAAAFSAFSLAADWNGTLLDQACFERQNQQVNDAAKAADACAATATSSSFALAAGGKVYKLDAASNSKAAAALKNRADRTEPGQAPGKIMAKVSGSEADGTIMADSIDIQ